MSQGTGLSTERLAVASCALGMLVYAGVVSLISTPEAAAKLSGSPEKITLTGVARDSRESHVDFNVLGVNPSQTHTITLVDEKGDGVYSYLADEFYPIDGQGFGDEGDPHIKTSIKLSTDPPVAASPHD